MGHMLLRERLLVPLRRRHSLAMVGLESPAGYGRSVLIDQALAEGPARAGDRDVVYRCVPGDDRPGALAARLVATKLGARWGQTVVVDRGMSGEENLKKILARGLHYLVAAPYSERHEWVEEFQDAAEFEEVRREPSPRNPFQKKSTIQVKLRKAGGETHVLCVSSERKEKDRAIRQAHEIERGHDPVMADHVHGAGLGEHALAQLAIARELRGEHLDRDAAADLRIQPLVHATHPALADHAHELIAADRGPEQRTGHVDPVRGEVGADQVRAGFIDVP